jgi:hypothetical protein
MPRIFRTSEITAEVLLASACLPSVHHAVEIAGKAYWDGGLTANPPLRPLIYECEARDLLLVRLGAGEVQTVPQTAEDIWRRFSEISFSASLYSELQGIALAKHAAERRPFSDGVIPTVFDRTLCPEGYHIMSLFTQWVPHEWSEEPHREELEAYADRVIDGYGELAPNLEGAILHRQVLGPYDMEQDIGLIGGNIFHGELSAEQLFHMRPAPGYADYRTPIRGLYQASSATHAGGGVCAIPAHNCVREIRKDRRRARFRRSRR